MAWPGSQPETGMERTWGCPLASGVNSEVISGLFRNWGKFFGKNIEFGVIPRAN